MRLHDFIPSHREKILEEWVVFARSCLPAASDMELGDLRDHANEMIDALILDLQNEQTHPQQNLKALGRRDAPRTLFDDAQGGTAAQSHGADRAGRGFTIEQMVSEYRALRASVLRFWLLDLPVVSSTQIEDLMRFNEAIDQALAESVSSFARVAEKTLRDARAHLEEHVEDRTRQLGQLNGALFAQIREREQAEEFRIRLLQQLVNAQEAEQRRIARELHDELGQQTTALGLRLHALRDHSGAQPDLDRAIESVEQIVRKLDEDIDLLVWRLRPTALDDLGLVEALSDYVSEWTIHSRIFVKLDVIGMEGDRLSSAVETVLYRVTQEALNNVAKHARAQNVAVELRHDADGTQLTITDDGAGFDLQGQQRDGSKHFGLEGMRERAALVGGTVTVDGRPGNGTTISVQIPAERP